MATNVIMPTLGFDMTEGTLARWLVEEGDRIEKGQAIAEIETEKATVEIEATASGVLAKVIVLPGRTVPVGTVIGVIAEPGEGVGEAPAPVPPPAPRAAGEEETGEPEAPADARRKASPVARRMAAEAGIDLARIRGTGPGGRVMERDVRAAIEARPPAPRPAGEEEEKGEAAAPARGNQVPLTRMRQAIARRMTESKTTAPHFYVTVEINMDEAMRVREQLNRPASDAEKVSINDLIVAAASRALARFPELNASYRDGSLELHPDVNIGIVVALEAGLLSPVLRNADRKSL
ncbi:MAG: dihydrolipoamide acetyltransferase family protein, partial [Gemmatimonadota bacterium]